MRSLGVATAVLALAEEPWQHGVLPCWDRPGLSRGGCCRKAPESPECFNDVFRRTECCGPGVVITDPAAPRERPDCEAMAGRSFGSDRQGKFPLRSHPALTDRQRQWELSMVNATVTVEHTIHGQRLRLRALRRDRRFLATVMRQVADGEYNLARLELPNAGKGLAVAVDIGAWVGVVALTLALLWGEAARILAVEAAPVSFRYLLWNIRMAGLSSRIWPVHAALGASSHSATRLLYYPLNPTVTHMEGQGWSDRTEEPTHSVEVDMLTFPELLAIYGIARVDFLKVDCEGCEWHLFGSAAWPRLRPRIGHVSAELHQLCDAHYDAAGCHDAAALHDLRKVVGCLDLREPKKGTALCSTLPGSG